MRWLFVVCLVFGGVVVAQEWDEPPPKRPPAPPPPKQRLDERLVEKVEQWLKRWAPWMLGELEQAVRRQDGRLFEKLLRFAKEMDELREREPAEFKEHLERMREEFERRRRERERLHPPHPPGPPHGEREPGFGPPPEGERPPVPPREELERFLKSDRFAVLREVAPWLLKRALKADPHHLPEILENLQRMNDELAELKHQSPERFELRVKVIRLRHKAEELALAFRRTDSEEKREHLRGALKETLTHLFKLRMKEMEHQIEDLARELERLKRLHARYRENAEKIIRRKLEQMLQEDEEFEW